MGKLDGKVAFITGGSGGIGAAEAALFVKEGARVGIGDVRDDRGAEFASSLGDSAIYTHLDVSDPDSWSEAIQATADAFGPVNVLVNTAGISRYAMIPDTTLDEYKAHVAVNQIGTFLGIKTVAESMKQNGGGSIVNVASTNGLRGAPGGTAYCSSKFAVIGITKCAAAELGPFGIRVNALCPGGVDTEMSRTASKQWFGLDLDDPSPMSAGGNSWQLPLRRMGQPQDIAQAALFLASDDSAYCTGAEFIVDGGLMCDHPIGPGGLNGPMV